MHSVYKLKGVVQHYNWGGKDFIPTLLDISNVDDKPFAEYWLGAHPNASSFLVDDNEISLTKAIEENALEILGERVKKKFGSLPYLFKILDVQHMLSIQVHPSKSSAVEEYKKENERGIALTAPNRNYKDQNHKPELMVALSDFWLLHGFKASEALKKIFASVPQLQFLQPVFESGGHKALYEEVMTMPQHQVNAVLGELLKKVIPLYDNNQLQKNDEHFWAARAAQSFCKNGNYDRGIFSIYLFNLLQLKEGEGIYQPAGLPHAYLEGQNVEVMANSDNVLRAGLTDKHVDVPELMKHVKFEATAPAIIEYNRQPEQMFECPAEEFLLTKYKLDDGINIALETATIVFIYNGEAGINSNGKKITAKRGEAFLMLAGKECYIEPSSLPLTFFTVTAPANKN